MLTLIRTAAVLLLLAGCAGASPDGRAGAETTTPTASTPATAAPVVGALGAIF